MLGKTYCSVKNILMFKIICFMLLLILTILQRSMCFTSHIENMYTWIWSFYFETWIVIHLTTKIKPFWRGIYRFATSLTITMAVSKPQTLNWQRRTLLEQMPTGRTRRLQLSTHTAQNHSLDRSSASSFT